MELRTLRAFVEVVRQGGFSQAAKTVFATQSTVSKAVKQLENEIGVPLLDRIGHRSRLTAAGEIVYKRALRILAERDDLIAEVDELRGLKRGALRLGLAVIGSTFAPLFTTYRRRYPGIEVRLVEYPGSERLAEVLLSGEIELAAALLPVSAATLLPISEDFEWQEVRREPLMALLPLEHPLSRRKNLDLAALRDMPFILFGAGFVLNRIVMDACKRRGFEPTVAARSVQMDFIVELVAKGMGVAFLTPTMAEQRKHPTVARVPLAEADTDSHLVMIWRRGAYLSHAAKAWLHLLANTRGKK
jgi:DNA-binding transcriptional LysR family regulator